MSHYVPPPAFFCPRPHHLPRCSSPLYQASRWIHVGFKKPHSWTSRGRNHDVKKRPNSSFVCQMVQAREILDCQQADQRPGPRPGTGADWAATRLVSGQTVLPKVAGKDQQLDQKTVCPEEPNKQALSREVDNRRKLRMSDGRG